MTIFEVLQNARYNLLNNGELGYGIGRSQLSNAMTLLEYGADLYDEFDDEKLHEIHMKKEEK